MEIQILNGTEQHPFGVDLSDWPNSIGLLMYLEEVAGIEVQKKFSWPLSSDFSAEFKFKNHLFEIESPISTPCLLATKGCGEELFNELIGHVRNYPGTNFVKLLFGFCRYLFLPFPHK